MADKSSQSFEIIPLPTNNQGAIDNNMFTVTGHKLNGQNYLQWSQSVLMFIYGKGKDDYLIGATTKPKEEDPTYRSWKAENNMVMS